MKSRLSAGLASASLFLIATSASTQTAFAQAADDTAGFELEEIVVTARRKDESLQDVPTTINAVTGEDIQKLNITKFEDIATVVPGLSMGTNQNGIGASATVRGVAYEVNASGNNGTVEFYMNDAPISAGNLFQTTYDVQQVELLRGPQGTLRGRASPSGSMTVTTRRADLQEMGGSASALGNNIGGKNIQAAFGAPIVSDVLAFRLAGAWDENENNRVTSFNHPAEPESETKSGRATIRFEPTADLQFNLVVQKTKQDIVSFDQVESQQVLFPGATVLPGAAPGYVPPFIRAEDRKAVADSPRRITQDFDNYNLQAQYAFLGQKLNYVGARNEQLLESFEPQDLGDFYNPLTLGAFPMFTGYGQSTLSESRSTAHELRLSSEERLWGVLDYIVGAFYQKTTTPTDLTQQTAVPVGLPGAPLVLNTPIKRRGGTEEKSVFTNVTAQVGESTEISAGVRYIKYESTGQLFINGAENLRARDAFKDSTVIYNATVKHNFSDDLMTYATVGSSWRPGVFATGDFNPTYTDLEESFLRLDPEKSTSYELGMKASAFDKRLRTAVSVYYQDFENFVYRSASGVSYVDVTRGTPRVSLFNFVAGVPVEVMGVELDTAYAFTSNWDVGLLASYSEGKIKNGFVPCDDYAPRDGVGDSAPTTNPATISATGDVISGCTVNFRASRAPLWSGTLQSEYRLPITETLNSFLRGTLSVYGDSKNDPDNPVDDYKSYELLNLFLGLRGADGSWEVSLYGKNVTESEIVLERSKFVTNGAGGQTNYYAGTRSSGLGMTAPREFGLSLRYAFGSK